METAFLQTRTKSNEWKMTHNKRSYKKVVRQELVSFKTSILMGFL